MARPVWKGAINFGLVHIPVQLYKATRPKDVRFRELHAPDQMPLKQKRVCSLDGEEVTPDEVVKGIEIEKDHFVVFEKKELQALEASASHSIDIEHFVDLDQVDPVYFENAYYITPDKKAERAYALLLRAMHDSGKAAVARMVMRTKQHLVLVREAGDVIALSTLFYSDEVMGVDQLGSVPIQVETSKPELEMARKLIESMSTEFDPENYHDEYRNRVLELAEQKAQGKGVKISQARPQPAKVIDLVAALKASLQKGGDAEEEEAPARKSKAKTSTRTAKGGSRKTAETGKTKRKAA